MPVPLPGGAELGYPHSPLAQSRSAAILARCLVPDSIIISTTHSCVHRESHDTQGTHEARPYMRPSGPRATMGILHHMPRLHPSLSDRRRAMPTCLMLTTHWRMPPRLSRGLAHVSRGHSITPRCRSPPGRCLSSAPSVAHRLTGGGKPSTPASQPAALTSRKPCMLAQRVHSTAWLNMSPAHRATPRQG